MPTAEALAGQVTVVSLGVGVSLSARLCEWRAHLAVASLLWPQIVSAARCGRAAVWAWEVARELAQAWCSPLAAAHRCP